jgi:ABC-2 type transport system ATP-binding protein
MGRDDFMQALRELASAGKSLVVSSHILHDLETLCGTFLILKGGRIQLAPHQAGVPGARERWPEATTFRCESPEGLARFFFARGLIRGCDIETDTGVLDVRWSDPDRFYGDFNGILLESGIRIYEVRGSGGSLEKAIEAPPFI